MERHCPECGCRMLGNKCVLCGYIRPAPAPVRGKLLAGVCIALIVVVMLATVIAAVNPGWLGF